MAEGLLKQNFAKRAFQPIVATGGTITNITDDGVRYRVHTFTANGTFEVTSLGDSNGQIEYLVIGGGGEGGNGVTTQGWENGGGGGAGGFRTGVDIISIDEYNVIVGQGGSTGTGGTSNPGTAPQSGFSSSFNDIVSAGGGRGGMRDHAGESGGSGGGNCSYNSPVAAAGQVQPGFSGNTPPSFPSQGNDGGDGAPPSGGDGGAGGGGGAGEPGESGSGSVAGAGGDGASSTISGTLTFYAGGGGGSGATAAAGGLGGGGAGSSSGNGTAAIPNTGSGGGGAFGGTNSSGGAGGSGIVIIRYPLLEVSSLYDFTSFTFTNGTQTGSEGPSLQNLLAAYDTNENPWLNNTEFFNTSDGIQLWTVPANGTYRIKAFGARMFPNREQGAVIQADVNLSLGDLLYILVGQEGSLDNGQPGSGGGTWVTKVDSNGDDVSFSSQKLVPVIVAGGAGNGNGVTSTSGGGTAGGINGNGGNQVSWSGSGGGWFTKGADASSGAAKGGEAFIDGGVGGEGNSASSGRIENRGGFGGGGGSSGTVVQGGGGYSGGGNGGGGSFIIAGATNVATSDGGWSTTGNEPHSVYTGSAANLNEYNDGHGKVEITRLS